MVPKGNLVLGLRFQGDLLYSYSSPVFLSTNYWSIQSLAHIIQPRLTLYNFLPNNCLISHSKIYKWVICLLVLCADPSTKVCPRQEDCAEHYWGVCRWWMDSERFLLSHLHARQAPDWNCTPQVDAMWNQVTAIHVMIFTSSVKQFVSTNEIYYSSVSNIHLVSTRYEYSSAIIHHVCSLQME